MDKRTFFDQLHSELSEKYNIPTGDIQTIRGFAFHQKMDRLDLMDWADNKLKKYKPTQRKPLKPQRLFNFLENLTDEAWEDITQITKFDYGRAS